MNQRAFRIFATLTFVFFISACQNSDNYGQSSQNVKRISIDQLHQMLKKKDFTLVNVHIPYAGEIPQTDLFIPYNEIEQHLNKLPAKNHKIVLYCRSDRMSTIAAKKLLDKGYSNIYNLEGGMNAWQSKGYMLKKMRHQAGQKTHHFSKPFLSRYVTPASDVY